MSNRSTCQQVENPLRKATGRARNHSSAGTANLARRADLPAS